MPAGYGQQGTYGPGMYLVSTRPGGASAIRLYEVTNNTLNNPQMNFYSATTNPYSPGVDADQNGSSDKLDARDNRLQNAFYLDGIVHYVFHSDIGNGWNGINYNRLQLSTLSNFSGTFGLQGSFDHVYPAVASFATSPSDQTVMISFLRSGPSIFPETRVVKCDHGFNWSNSTLVKAGCYGANVTGQLNNTWKTWVAEIVGDGTSTSIESPETAVETKIFPNPSYDFFTLEFEAPENSRVAIELFDMEGKLVKNLYYDYPKAGLNHLVFNKEALPPGSYLLNIESEEGPISHEQIIILE